MAGCIPIYVPGEILHAAGMLPVTVWGNEFPDSPRMGVPSFVCSVAAGVVSAIRSGNWRDVDAWIFPSTCDTLQNAFEALFPQEEERPRFPLVFPASTDSPGAPEYLLDRLEAFREWAGKVAGREVSDGALERAVRTYNENRRTFSRLEERMTESPGFLSGTEYLTLARAGMVIPREGHTEILRKVLAHRSKLSRKVRAKIFVTGMMATPAVMKAIDAAGAAIVGNDLALGHRFYTGTANETGDMLLSLVRRHMEREPYSTLHGSGGLRIDALFRRFSGSGAERMLVLRMRQCESESGDLPDVAGRAKDLGIPFLGLDIDLDVGNGGSVRTSIAAFVEAGE